MVGVQFLFLVQLSLQMALCLPNIALHPRICIVKQAARQASVPAVVVLCLEVMALSARPSLTAFTVPPRHGVRHFHTSSLHFR